MLNTLNKLLKTSLFARDLSEHADLQDVIMSSFNSPTEEVKSAASYALGK